MQLKRQTDKHWQGGVEEDETEGGFNTENSPDSHKIKKPPNKSNYEVLQSSKSDKKFLIKKGKGLGGKNILSQSTFLAQSIIDAPYSLYDFVYPKGSRSKLAKLQKMNEIGEPEILEILRQFKLDQGNPVVIICTYESSLLNDTFFKICIILGLSLARPGVISIDII